MTNINGELLVLSYNIKVQRLTPGTHALPFSTDKFENHE